jgi:hypothetical protein
MNTRKTIYDKLFTEKVELAKHEVELANIKDIPRKLKSVLDSQKKLDKSMPELEKLKKINKNKYEIKHNTKQSKGTFRNGSKT